MRVAYNNQFGGFSLSNEALALLSEYKGIKLDNYLVSELPRHDSDLIKVVSLEIELTQGLLRLPSRNCQVHITRL